MEWPLLKFLIADAFEYTVYGDPEIAIGGLSSNSKKVSPGDLFIAKRGRTVDGATFIEEAVRAGAVAIVAEQYHPRFPHIVQIVTRDIGRLEAHLAKRFYRHADEELFLIGITGTAGKTTISFLIRHLFEELGVPCGLIGSIGSCIKGEWTSSSHTTPDLLTTHSLLRRMVDEGCRVCAMEVSSIGLDQGRTLGLEFDVAIFSNLTREHLDYHHTMQAYGEAKAKLFRFLGKGNKHFEKIALLNGDDPYHAMLTKQCNVQVRTFGFSEDCFMQAKDLALHLTGMSVRLYAQGEKWEIQSSLIGRHNAYNLFAALGAGEAWGFSISEMVCVLSSFSTVPGRLERVENAAGFHIIVDHAHKEDALLQVLRTLRECAPARIITVFGCGGDRDRTKRPRMGAIAERLSDEVIVTSDNPRSEDETTIAVHIVQGMAKPERARVVLDRKKAIQQAIALARPSDVVLIAGKGHEKEQIFSNYAIPFDDVKIAKEMCAALPLKVQ